MATLTIPFPEGTRTVALRGNRITIGRLPDNTIQIRDRTISAYHAELVVEGDHYRVHDTGSTNGVLIDGRRAADFHLHDACKLQLGSVVCEFAAGDPAQNGADTTHSLPTRSEMVALQQSNSDLKNQVETLRVQVESMLKARNDAGDGEGPTVSLEKYDQLAAEAVQLRNTLQERQTQIDRLTSLLAVVTRERDTLQRGYDDARTALEKARAAEGAHGANGTAAAPAASAPAAPKPGPTAAPRVPAAPGAPTAPKAPTAPPPRVPAAAGNGSSGNGSSLPKPPMSLPGSTPSRRPASAVTTPPKAPAYAATASAGVGPKGTQKLVE